MSQQEQNAAFDPETFSGRVRLFPLPNLVLFPHVVQPLHIFEPRYVELLQDALAQDRLIAMALLDAGWEQDYEGRPPVGPIACLGKVLSWQSQPKARYNLLLLGVRRVRIVRELPASRAFREADVELVEDDYPIAGADARPVLHRRLIAAFEKVLPSIADADEMFNPLSMNTISLGMLTDVISFALQLDIGVKQAMLAERNVDRRAKLLLAHLKNATRQESESSLVAGFPPAFSSN